MKINTSYIYLENVTFYSYHGVLLQERKVGNTFIINLRLLTDTGKAAQTDNVNDTVNYAEVYTVLKEEMSIPSNLLEHVCSRIAERLFRDFPAIKEIRIKLSKKNPPIEADIESSSVEITCVRD